jgi:hypothetical protein
VLAALDQEGLMDWMLKLGVDWRPLTAPGRDMQFRQPRSHGTQVTKRRLAGLRFGPVTRAVLGQRLRYGDLFGAELRTH